MSNPKDDSWLFRQMIGEVKKIDYDGVDLPTPKPAPVPYQTNISEQETFARMTDTPFDIPDIENGDKLYFKRDGIQERVMRKLRRGQFVIESELDLHGMTASIAKKELDNFLSSCQSTDRRCVKIIHGKGHRSANKMPVLKNKLNKWLRQYNTILAFCSTPSQDGGTGAVYVLIKKHSSLHK